MRVLLLLLSVLLTALHAVHALRVVHTLDEVAAAVDTARGVKIVLALSSASDAKLRELAKENDATFDDAALVQALEAQFPHVRKIVDGMDGAVEFLIADIADAKAAMKKWSTAQLPALVIYKDAPKKNPYTRKMYREAAVLPPQVLQKPRELKKLLKDSIPSTYVTEWNAASKVTTLKQAEDAWNKESNGGNKKLVVLISKQAAPSHLYRALALEYEPKGLSFVYVNNDDAVATELKEKWSIEKLPALAVVTSAQSLDQVQVLSGDDKLKSFADLKAAVEPFVTAPTDESTTTPSSEDAMEIMSMPLLTAENFDKYVTESKLSWVVSFMDEETEAKTNPAKWKEMTAEAQRKLGIVGLGGVSCKADAALCEQYGAGSIRVFPIVADEATGDVKRGEVLPQSFTSIEEAKQAAIDAIPDTISVLATSAELNAFVSRALTSKSMPVLLITSKMEKPTILKSLALSFASQKLSVAVVSDADPVVRQQFQVAPKAKSTFVCLVTVPSVPDQPENASPFGIFKYDKKTMGAMTYPNLVRFLVTVLHQHPHRREEASDAFKPNDLDNTQDGEASGDVTVPYLTQANFDSLCGRNKICAIGFFEGHVDTAKDESSPLSKSLRVLHEAARKSTKSRQPFVFMWTNGKCQSDFASSFGVGAFQMPTVVVYSPSKARYATNIGVFDEENTGSFLSGVLSGKIGTSPVAQVGALRDECTAAELVDEVAVAADGTVDGDDDLGDLLSEIIGEEEQQRRALEAELAKARGPKKEKARKKKKGKKGKKKDHEEL